MKKCKIKLETSLIDKIASSHSLSQNEKLQFLKYVGYMTQSEKKELEILI